MGSSEGLVGHWEFKEKSGLVANDSSRYKNTGTLSGATVPDWKERGLYFNGSTSYVDCGNGASLNITNQITCLCWLNLFVEPISFSRIIEKFSTNGWVLLYNNAAPRKVYMSFARGGAGIGDTNLFPISTPFNTWTHVAITWNGSSAISYRNSVFLGSSIVIGPITVSGTNQLISIGKNRQMDDIKIYNRALSASEISDYYESTKHLYL